ncbi:cell division protein CrgA [Mumia zhuanghuii]|uniref:Cell division protein CrgA n=2 Tax=Mumia TaxID=1546255 RepID=A0ABW1QQ09_9ACTN|nr:MULTISPECIES: cell division protein CrgA [Mumia]KAA1424871.1 cell division protein CrgA [Mumia zhuanghuii]
MSEAESKKSAARSGNPAKREAAAAPAKEPRKPAKPVKIGNRWAAPLMIACAVIGLVWIVAFYVAGNEIPGMKELGSWNLVIGMGFIVAAFGFAMKWE